MFNLSVFSFELFTVFHFFTYDHFARNRSLEFNAFVAERLSFGVSKKDEFFHSFWSDSMIHEKGNSTRILITNFDIKVNSDM